MLYLLRNLLFLLYSFQHYYVPSITQSCSPPYGSTSTFDACAMSANTNLYNATLINAGYLYQIDHASYASLSGKSIADLLDTKLVAGDQQAYSGTGPTQNVDVVDALTANLRLGYNGSIITFDQTQLLAAGLFAPSIDYYPNIMNPYLLYLEDLDDISASLTDIDTNIALAVSYLSTIATALAPVSVPTSIAGGVILTTAEVPLVKFLFDALYMMNVDSCNGTGYCTVSSIPIRQALMAPYLDPISELHSPGTTCPWSGLGSSMVDEPFYLHGASLVGPMENQNSGREVYEYSFLTTLPNHVFQLCDATPYGTPVSQNSPLRSVTYDGNAVPALYNIPMCGSVATCP
jgi:hypothetical protein